LAQDSLDIPDQPPTVALILRVLRALSIDERAGLGERAGFDVLAGSVLAGRITTGRLL